MNTKKNKIFFLVTLINIYATNTIAQLGLLTNGDNYVVEYKYDDNAGRNVKALLGPTTAIFSPSNPGNLVWYEFGDGKFTFLPSFKHSYAKDATISNTLLKITGVYEGGGKPTKPSKPTKPVKPTRILNASNLPRNGFSASNINYEANDVLNSGYNVKITPSINAIKNNDTMHFAIDYMVPNNMTDWKLIFEYNINGVNIFKQTDLKQKIKDHYDGFNYVPFIRVHNGENINSMTNRVVFSDLRQTKKAKTVFITLVSNGNSALEGFDGGIRAFLIRGNSNTPDKGNMDQSNLRNLGDRPYDPNYVKVDKKCIKPNTMNMILNYQVHFQNTGTGNADDIVEVAISLPDGITPSQFSPTGSEVRTNYGARALSNYLPYNSKVAKNFLPGIVYYDNARSDSLFFAVKQPESTDNIILNGMNPTKPNFMDDPKTMGDIYFKIILPSYNAPKNLEAIAAIVFDTEEPVVTNTELTKVRKRCDKKDDPTNGKNSFLQWLLTNCD